MEDIIFMGSIGTIILLFLYIVCAMTQERNINKKLPKSKRRGLNTGKCYPPRRKNKNIEIWKKQIHKKGRNK